MLKARATDTNKVVQALALDIIARIATGMGKPFEKHTRFYTLPVATVLADQKAPIRSSALQTLSAIASACEGVESMVPGLTTALETTNPTQRTNLLQWIQQWFQEHEPPASLDLSGWAGPVVLCLDDRNSDVRKAAQGILPIIITCAGFDYVMQQTSSLKPASRASATPLIQAARSITEVNAPSKGVTPPPSKPNAKPIKAASSRAPPESPQPQSPTIPTPKSPKSVVPSKLTGVRRKLPQGTQSRPESRAEDPPAFRLTSKSGIAGINRSATTSSSTKTAQSPTASNLPFSGVNGDAKKGRLSKDASKWINEGGPTRKDLAEALQHQMEPCATKDLIAQLFSHDHNAVNDHVSGLGTMADFYSSCQVEDEKFGVPLDDMKAVALANYDFPLKYVSIKAHEPQSNLISKCLDVVDAVLGFLRSVNCQLSDAEALCFIPTMVFKVRHRFLTH